MSLIWLASNPENFRVNVLDKAFPGISWMQYDGSTRLRVIAIRARADTAFQEAPYLDTLVMTHRNLLTLGR